MVALNTALGDIAVATGATQTQLTWIVDSYTLLLACLLLPAGAIGDRYGRRTALLVGLAIFAGASFAPLILGDPVQIIIARALAGAGAAFVMPATLSLLTVAYPPEARTKAVGVWAGVAGSGKESSAYWAPVCCCGSGSGSRSSGPSAVPPGLPALFVLALTIAESREGPGCPTARRARRGDDRERSSVAVFASAIFAVAPEHGWTDPRVYGCLIAGVALAVVFGTEHKNFGAAIPCSTSGCSATPNSAPARQPSPMVFLGTFALFYLVTQFVQQVMGYTPLATAIALAPLAVPLLTFSSLSSWYLPRVGLRAVVFVSMILVSVGFICMRTLTPDSTYVDLLWPLLIISSGFGLCTAPTTSAIMTAAPDAKQGVASAVNDATREVGGALGIAMAGSILASSYSHAIGPALTRVPEPVRGPASDSLAQAIAVADRLWPPAGTPAGRGQQDRVRRRRQLVLPRDGRHRRGVAAVIPMFAPGRDGRQMRVMRRLKNRRPATAD